jgi:antitoxin (DNA-binding transcriptional repressor) of toxin-antitoxin stability system
METGVRELRDNLSRYIRLAGQGERVVVTAHGRIVAELVPPDSVLAGGTREPGHVSELARLIASGAVTPPAEDGDPLEDCPAIRLAPGSAADLIDSDRDEK